MVIYKPLNCFFTYFGGKWHLAKKYPKPTQEVIIEPFAGSAGYALHYPQKQVRLYDLDPVICGMWDYLIKVSTKELQALPDDIVDFSILNVPQEAKWLMGFWCQRAGTKPNGSPSGWFSQRKWPKAFWGSWIKQRLCMQVPYIRHWKIFNHSYEFIENTKATWFIDPPYQNIRNRYTYSKINYLKLKEWSTSRLGQVIICENERATWLSFEHLHSIKTIKNTLGQECVWIKND